MRVKLGFNSDALAGSGTYDESKEAVIAIWFKKVGDIVEKDEPLFEFETSKATMELESPISGVIVEINQAYINDPSWTWSGDRRGRPPAEDVSDGWPAE